MTTSSPIYDKRAPDLSQLQAPQDDGATLAEPPLEAVGDLVLANEQARRAYRYDFQGRSLERLTADARSDLVRRASVYTRRYRDVAEPSATGRVFLTGHQPEMFHPGVWFKNFALSQLAQDHNAVAVNLLIDTDTLKSPSLRVPGGSVAAPQARAILFDQPSAETPYEERPILDRDTFASFGQRAAEFLRPLVPNPLLAEYWPLVQTAAENNNNLGACLAEGRHRLEGQWGLATLELPESQVCQSEAFCWFAAHLLANLPRFWDIYNSSLAEYRRHHHLRSVTHPVPDLADDGQWLEAPFWIWRGDDSVRRPLYARQDGEWVVMADRAGFEMRLPISPECDAGRAAALLYDLPARGVKLRTRALITTLWARLTLSDLFLHGIGGAKYDQLTDVLACRFFGFHLPGFMALSATKRLPIPRACPRPEELRQVEALLRQLTFQPERRLDTSGLPADEAARAQTWIDTKRRWIDAEVTPDNARARFLALREANQRLQPWVAGARGALLARRAALQSGLRNEAVLSSREYGFCLFPEENLQSFLLAIRSNTS